jgi:hypothetical protein
VESQNEHRDVVDGAAPEGLQGETERWGGEREGIKQGIGEKSNKHTNLCTHIVYTNTYTYALTYTYKHINKYTPNKWCYVKCHSLSGRLL